MIAAILDALLLLLIAVGSVLAMIGLVVVMVLAILRFAIWADTGR